jgi:2-keto-4-pentenoate hydratase/2-oxohepta-3-ene-1,7-dioic acid hydratase in catechol pathway
VRLISFAVAGRESYGAVAGDQVIDLGRRFGAAPPTLRAAIAAGAIARMRSELSTMQPDYALSAVTLRPPIPDPDKIICIGLNYKAHAAEGGFKIPERPQLFSRLTNTLVAHGAPFIRPKVSGDFDYEGELALVIGRAGRHIAQADALAHVCGYACFNDGSIRDYQFKHSLTAGKNFPSTGGFGPWIATADEIGDPAQLTLTTRVNGTVVQHKGIDDMIFTVPQIVSYVSSWTRLEPGDVIATGTPEGVGFARKPPLWLKPGDAVEIEISRIGVLRNPVAMEAD